MFSSPDAFLLSTGGLLASLLILYSLAFWVEERAREVRAGTPNDPRRLPSDPDIRLVWVAQDLREQGKLVEAVAAYQQQLLSSEAVPAFLINSAVEMCISAGRYREALSIATDAKMRPSSFHDRDLLLIQINLAEAEYSLGSWQAARQRLDALGGRCDAFPITRAGALLQRAWIEAHEGNGEEADRLCEAADPMGLPVEYRAEYYFTLAIVCLALNRTDTASVYADAGRSSALRASSRRNALFLRGRVEAARADWAACERVCRAGAVHFYRGQGGDGLLLWGDALARLGRDAEAKEAWALAQVRDPESESAALAKRRLEQCATRASG